MVDSDKEPLEVMEAIASKAQEHNDYDSEVILETFETYAMVRQNMKEKNVNCVTGL